AVKRTFQSLPKDPSKRVDVIHHIAQVLNVIPATKHHKREQRSLSNALKELVIKFYNRDDVSYQMPEKEIKWYQWILNEGFAKKQEFNDTIQQCLADLQEKIKPFLWHVFIKRQQASYFEQMKPSKNDETVCLQVDFSEDFRMDIQDAIQGSYYSKKSVSLFTSHVWCSSQGFSFVYVLDNCTHDKYCISTILNQLFDEIKKNSKICKTFMFFSDGAAQQFKQRFLFRNLCRLADLFKIELYWHYFATSHGKGMVDGLGATVKRLVYSAILAGQHCNSAADFVVIAKSKANAIEISEIKTDFIDDSMAKIEPIFKSVKPILETKKIHSI
ncbi:unnamed protein product, partial [Rotaria magnacalcarata]